MLALPYLKVLTKAELLTSIFFKQHCNDATNPHHYPFSLCPNYPICSPNVGPWLFEMLDGGPIAVWSESGLEAWNKLIGNFRSEAGCRVRRTSVKSNLEDILVCMLIIYIFNDIFNKTRHSAVPHVEATDDSLSIYLMYSMD